MTSMFFLLLLAAAAAAWLLRPPTHRQAVDEQDLTVDQDVLDEAEQEVQELDTFTTPEDADDELPDWGPGAPH